MMSLAKQMYDYYVKPYLGEKGQDMVEYALMLAIIVGIGWRFTSSPALQIALTMYLLMLATLWKKLTTSLLAHEANGSLGKVQRAPAKAGVLWKGGQS